MDIKVLVALHKPYWQPEDMVYLPIHVGAARGASWGIARDDTGDNISERNPSYCELTALYWAWKNLDCAYLGLCHYRRYFAKGAGGNLEAKKQAILTYEDYAKLLQNCDVLVPKKRHYYIETVRSHYEHAHHKEDLDLVEQMLQQQYPDYVDAFKSVMESTSLYRLNMFVMPKRLADQYCVWLFSILFELEKQLNFSKYDNYQLRVMGFLAERLFNVWLEKQQLRVQEVAVVNLEPVNWPKKLWKFIGRKYFRGR